MINCGCRKPGYCAREAGAMPPGQKIAICRNKIIVPRHEPTIDREWLWKRGTGYQYGCWKDKMEPIEDEK